MKAYVFPGQGSQFIGMGAKLFDKYSNIISDCDDILGYSIKDLCLKDDKNQLGQTQFTQPALYIVNSLYYFEQLEENKEPAMVAGHSLGEYNALLAGGVFDFTTGLKLVKKRGELMAQANGGGMAAILNLDVERIKEVLQQNDIYNLYITNYNSPTQIVIGGELEMIINAKKLFESFRPSCYIILNVSSAFHSIYMNDAKEKFNDYIYKFKLKQPKIPVISNLNARPYEFGNLQNTLVEQITSPVKWIETIVYMREHCIQDIEQLGPGSVLTGFNRQINWAVKKGNITLNIDSINHDSNDNRNFKE